MELELERIHFGSLLYLDKILYSLNVPFLSCVESQNSYVLYICNGDGFLITSPYVFLLPLPFSMVFKGDEKVSAST